MLIKFRCGWFYNFVPTSTHAVPIAAANVRCSRSASSLGECTMQSSAPARCTHRHDVEGHLHRPAAAAGAGTLARRDRRRPGALAGRDAPLAGPGNRWGRRCAVDPDGGGHAGVYRWRLDRRRGRQPVGRGNIRPSQHCPMQRRWCARLRTAPPALAATPIHLCTCCFPPHSRSVTLSAAW